MDDYGGTCLVGDGGGRRLEWASNGDVEEGDGATQVGGKKRKRSITVFVRVKLKLSVRH